MSVNTNPTRALTNTASPVPITIAEYRTAIARNLKAEAVRRGHRPTAYFAEVLGQNARTIRRKLKGESAFDTDEIAALAGAMNIDPSAVFPNAPVVRGSESDAA